MSVEIKYDSLTGEINYIIINDLSPEAILKQQIAEKLKLKIEFDQYRQETIQKLLDDLLLNWDNYIKIKNTIVDEYKIKKTEYEAKVK